MKKIILYFTVILLLVLIISPLKGWTATTYNFSTIDFPMAAATDALGLNDTGQVVGYYIDDYGLQKNFLLSNGSFSTVNMGGTFTSINNSGQIAGYFSNGTSAFIRDGNGNATTFTIPGASYTNALGINNLGQVVGYNSSSTGRHGYVRNSDGSYFNFDVPTSMDTRSQGINDFGDIVGHYYADNNYNLGHGFIRHNDGTFTTIDVPGATYTFLMGINNTGQIIGQYVDTLSKRHNFLLSDNTINIIDVPGSEATYVGGNINNSGQFVGRYYENGSSRGFLASPAPEPISSILFVAGGTFLIGRRYFRKKQV